MFWKTAIRTALVCNRAYLKQDQQTPSLPYSALWPLHVNFYFFWIAVVVVARRWSLGMLQRGWSQEAHCQTWHVRRVQPLGQAVLSSFGVQSLCWPDNKPPYPLSSHLPRAHRHHGRWSPCSLLCLLTCPQVHLWFEERRWAVVEQRCLTSDQREWSAYSSVLPARPRAPKSRGCVIPVFLWAQSLAHVSYGITFWMVTWYKEGFPFSECHSHCWFGDSFSDSGDAVRHSLRPSRPGKVSSTLVIASVLLETCVPRKIIHCSWIIPPDVNSARWVLGQLKVEGTCQSMGEKMQAMCCRQLEFSFSEVLRHHSACWSPEHSVSSLGLPLTSW